MALEFKITHRDDPDGLISMALLARASDSVINPSDHCLISYDSDESALRKALADIESNGVICVADINFSQRLRQAGGSDWALLRELRQKATVKWFDHHDGTKQQQPGLERLGVEVYHPGDKKICAAVLVARAMNCHGDYNHTLAGIAQAHDYQTDLLNRAESKNLRLGHKLQKIISLANSRSDLSMLLELVSGLKSETVLSSSSLARRWEQVVAESEKEAASAYQKLETSVERREIAGYQVAFGYCPAILSQKPGWKHLQSTVGDIADIYVCLFAPPVRNHIIIQREGSVFPLEKLLTYLGGGGRNGGGGYSVNYDLSAESLSLEKDRLANLIETISPTEKSLK